MKKIFALLLALAMVFSFAACKDDGDGETTDPAAVGGSTDTAGTVDGSEASSGEDSTATSGDASTEPQTTPDGSVVEPSNAGTQQGGTQQGSSTGSTTLNAAQLAQTINTETAKIAKSGSYSFKRVCNYTKAIDVGGATDTLNDIIQGIDENSSLDSVVGGFLGIGTTTGSIPKNKNDVSANYLIKATSLKSGDLKITSSSNGVYKFTIASATNPKKNGATPLARFTNDFFTHEEVNKGITDFTSAIKLNTSTVHYTNITGEVTIKNGKITAMKYSYNFDAALGLKALGIIPIDGTGAAKNTNTYSNIAY